MGLLGGIMGGGMSMLGTGLGALEQQRVQDIMSNLPEYKPVDINASQKSTVEGNLNVLPEASKLTSQANLANVTSAQEMYRQMLPGYDRMLKQASDMISGQMSGQLFGEDVAASLAKSAGKALGGGFAGSGMWKNLSARDLGMQTYQLTQQGLNNAMNWFQVQKGMMPQALSVASMFLTPEARLGADLTQAQRVYESDLTKALGKTTPGAMGYWGQSLQTMGSSMMSGGGGGGGGGGGLLGGLLGGII